MRSLDRLLARLYGPRGIKAAVTSTVVFEGALVLTAIGVAAITLGGYFGRSVSETATAIRGTVPTHDSRRA
jgi:hypothetical protein